MRYMGGKARQAKRLVESLPAADVLVEPFGGGASVTAAAAFSGKFKTILAYDANESVALFWAAIIDGWLPPTTMTRETYDELRIGDPSPMKAWAGFACSYVGKWFSGYGPEASGRFYLEESLRSTIKKRDAMRLADVRWAGSDYLEVDIPVGSVVYCDPPYADSESYSAVDSFDSVAFWNWASQADNIFVSEFKAPNGWLIVDSWNRPATVNHSDSKKRTELLFTSMG